MAFKNPLKTSVQDAPNDDLSETKSEHTGEGEKSDVVAAGEEESAHTRAKSLKRHPHSAFNQFERMPWVTTAIKAEMGGEQLDVKGVGSFTIDWHLGGDLKKIKFMIGCSQGENFANPCPWCMLKVKQKDNKRC